MQIVGLMPFISTKVHLITVLFSFKTINNFSSHIVMRSFTMIIGTVSPSPTYASNAWIKTSIPISEPIQHKVKPFHENSVVVKES